MWIENINPKGKIAVCHFPFFSAKCLKPQLSSHDPTSSSSLLRMTQAYSYNGYDKQLESLLSSTCMY